MDRKKPCKAGENKSEVVKDVPLACASEPHAVEFMEKQRWGGDPCCPLCGSVDVYQMQDRKMGGRERNYRWRCRDCKKRYTVRTGTVMEQTRMGLRFWCHAFWRVCSSKKGVSALQLQRETGISYKSALFLMHRVRFAMADMVGVKLTGTVEVDETYVGGKPRHSYNREKQIEAGLPASPNARSIKDRKTPVFAAVQRDGEVRAMVLPDVRADNLKKAVHQFVDQSADLMTDESHLYKKIGPDFASHQTVNHSGKEYVRVEPHMIVTTNTIEGFFSLLKRGVYGTFHNVSRKHLHRYLSEFEFRYNTRSMDDGARTVAAIKGGEGKRLMYREPPAAA